MAEIQYSDQLLAELFDAQPQAVIWYKPIWTKEADPQISDFEYSYFNKEASVYTGLSKEQLAGIRVRSSPLLDEEMRKVVFDILLEVYQTGKQMSSHIYNTVLQKHVKVLWSRIQGGVLIVAQDQTEEHKLIAQLEEKTKQLEEQKAFSNSVLDASLNAIYTCKAIRNASGQLIDMLFLQVNKAYTRMLGKRPEEVIGNTMLTVYPSAKDLDVLDEFGYVLQTGNPLQKVRCFKGEGLHNWYQYVMVKKGDDEVVTTFADITAEKEAQLQLERSMEEIKRTNANLEEFTYAASHDLKEPIRKIRTFANRLKTSLQTSLTSNELHWFDRMDNATERMKLLVDDLLTYSHVSQGTGLAEEVNLNDKLNLVLGDLELLVEEKKAKIHVGNLPVITGYRRQLQQLFHNLLSNALKYNKPGIPPDITISYTKVWGRDTGLNLPTGDLDREYHLIEVSDKGVGFDQKDAERIFNVFQRLHFDEVKGTGVGLSIARKVVENHKGFISAKGEPGLGATFQILLPIST